MNIGKYYLSPQIGNRKLSEITPGQLQRAIDAAAAKGLSRVTCKNVRGVIVTLLKFARRQRWECVRLEDGDLTLPKDATPPKQKNVLSSEDIQTLFTDGTVSHYGSRADSWYIHAWRFLVLSGLRRGELCGLRQEDIHDGLISISRSINANGDITRGKNDNARRTFAITRHMQQVLDDQSAMLRDRGIISPWVFPDRYGEAISPYNIYRQWVSYKTQHGIKCTLHELRHTFISLNKSDVPLELMKTVVGHSQSMDTFGIYGHEVDEDQARAAGIIDAVFDRVLPDVGGKVGGE